MTKTPQQVINEKAKNSIFRFLAMDANGDWYFYEKEPFSFSLLGIMIWTRKDTHDGMEKCNEDIIYNGDWEQSLHEAHS